MEWIFYILVGVAFYLLLDSIANSIVSIISTLYVMLKEALVRAKARRAELARLELEKTKASSDDSVDSRIIDD